LHFIVTDFEDMLFGVGRGDRMSVTTQSSAPLPTAFGAYVAEQHAEEAQRSNLPALDQEVGIASLWVIFYVVLAAAAAIHYVFHA
jgi:hypothetical protein